ncbi:MAG: hypothetical protein O3C40_18190 [Planctomycetota bacterium]|nr:hypothetical protein [Planctomycetota bacterium]
MSNTAGRPSLLRTLAILAVLQTCLYGGIAFLSWEFDFDRAGVERPIVPVLVLFAAAFVAYLFAIRISTRAVQDRRLLAVIIGPAIVFRTVLLFSVPIQEIDIYRYVWDGAVSNAGVHPFQFSPEQVRIAAFKKGSGTVVRSTLRAVPATVPDPFLNADLRRIIRTLDHEPAMVDVLRRVHFGELPTIYPPVSQAVFAASEFMVPANSSVATHVFIMKCWLVGFDVATLFVLIGLLKLCRKPLGLCLIYAWCPLLLKEVANSGHLDAIAVFLTTLAVYLTVRLLVALKQSERSSVSKIMYGCGVALVLALAVGAKLYPVVLAPLVFAVLAGRIGFTKSLMPAAAFVGVTLCVVWPMLRRDFGTPPPSSTVAVVEAPPAATAPPTIVNGVPASDPSLGVTTFLRRWEMNDFLFLLVVENLKPNSQVPPERMAWFSIVPDGLRQQLVAAVTSSVGVTVTEVPFLCARAITAGVFLLLAGCFAWRAARTPDVSAFCEAGFLTLAWFWLLCPTQNPWYWTWALPLLPFARSRVWLLMSGLALLYYLRFWLSYHFPDTSILGSGYAGAQFFDFVVTWIEFAPWLVWLTVESLWPNRQRLPVSQPRAPAHGVD